MTITHSHPAHPAPVRGRPSLFSEEIAERLLERICDTNESLRTICKLPGYPSRFTVMKWKAAHPEFGHLLHEAMAGRAEDILMEGLEIADNSAADWAPATDDEGIITLGPNKDHISRVKLALDYRLQIAARLAPKTTPQGPMSQAQAVPGVSGALLLDQRVLEGHQLRQPYEAYERALAERR